MLKSFTIKNFKSFREATLPLAPLTLLIGANASGKSNAIEAMQLLSWLTSGNPLNDLLYVVREQEISLRGGFSDLSGDGGDITLGCEVTDDPENVPLSFTISFQVTEEEFRIATEQVTRGTQTLYSSQNETSKPEKPFKEPRVFRFAEIAERFREQHSGAVSKILPLAQTLSSMLFLDPDPRRMREYSFVQEKRLKRDGSALSAVLHHLTEEEGQKAKTLGFIRSLPEQDINDITYLKTQRGEVMVRLHETFGGKAVPREAALLSDGTLRVLAVAAALLSAEEGSVIVVEEIDNGVHPSRAAKLLLDIQTIARERNLRVLLTTHNPALLDALPLEAVPDTVACYRDPKEGDSRLIRLEDLESYPELVAQGPLGSLVTRGVLDRFLKDPAKRDKDLKVEQGLAWLSDFRRKVESA